MRLVSWNVNGLRSAEEKFIEFIKKDRPDMLLVQELRARPDQLSFFVKSIPGYKTLFNPSGRPGYGGTAAYYKDDLSQIDISKETGVDLLDTEGRSILTKIKDIFVFNFYMPNGNSSDERFRYKMDFHSAITENSKDLLADGKKVIITGDFNIAHTELDLFNPKTSLRSGFTREERDWFSDLLKMGFIDTFRMFENGGGHYTWWNMRDPKREQNLGWRFDYFLVSENLKKSVGRSEILKDVYGSDHCPIMLDIEI